MVFQRESWSKADYMELVAYLKSLGEEKLQRFHQTLTPNAKGVLGIRLPQLRLIAKEIAKGNWRAYLAAAENSYHEETMLCGLVIGYAKAENIEEVLQLIEDFAPRIYTWAICDSFCTGLKIVKKHPQKVLPVLLRYLASKEEYNVRFAVVMLMSFFIEEERIDSLLVQLNNVSHEGYYVKMAVAWALSVCFVKFPNQTMYALQNNTWDDFTYQKALQKITESYRVDDSTKAVIRQMRKNKK